MATAYAPRTISLVLSGGGTRAMAYHLGVLRYLAAQGCLERVQRISTVSGGSLLVGLVMQRSGMAWPTSKQFLEDTYPRIAHDLQHKSLLKDALAQLLDPANWRYLLSRANLIAKALEHQWGVTAKVSDLPQRPDWSINGTTAETGRRFRFKRDSMGDWQTGYAEPTDVRLAEAMAVSAAFPGGIGPLSLPTRRFAWRKRDEWNGPERAVERLEYPRLRIYDGGVYDNLGLEPFFDGGTGRPKHDALIVVADAGAPLEQGFAMGALSPFRLKRLMDIMSEQTRALRVRTFIEYAKRTSNAAYLYIADRDFRDAPGAKLARDYPTGLGRMQAADFDAIAGHGYRVAELHDAQFQWSKPFRDAPTPAPASADLPCLVGLGHSHYTDGRNRFFERDAPAGAGSGRVYAAYEVEAEDGEPQTASLECIDADWLDEARVDGAGWIAGAPLSIIELPTSRLRPDIGAAGEGALLWFEIEFEAVNSDDAEARKFDGLFSEGVPIHIRSLRRIGEQLKDHLDETLRWFRGFEVSADRLAITTHPSAGVAVFDVGQGAMQALMHDVGDHLAPSVYFDLGGGALQNTSTFPAAFGGACFGLNPEVVLSHWDCDHWSSALRFPRALFANWVAPPLQAKPVQLGFAYMLGLRNRLRIWSDAPGSTHSSPGLILERCTGKSSNDSGICVTATSGWNEERRFLLPGDASYQHIPSVRKGTSFDALSVTHHGGRLHSRLVPAAQRNASAVCSVGAGNTYRHPFSQTFQAHTRKGWPHPILTGSWDQRPAHIFVPWGRPARGFTGSCGVGPSCSVGAPIQ